MLLNRINCLALPFLEGQTRDLLHNPWYIGILQTTLWLYRFQCGSVFVHVYLSFCTGAPAPLFLPNFAYSGFCRSIVVDQETVAWGKSVCQIFYELVPLAEMVFVASHGVPSPPFYEIVSYTSRTIAPCY